MTMSLKQVDMCSWIGINNIVKMTILPQTIYNQLNFYQITSGLFHGIRIITVCIILYFVYFTQPKVFEIKLYCCINYSFLLITEKNSLVCIYVFVMFISFFLFNRLGFFLF